MPPRNYAMNSEHPLVHQGNDKSGAVLVKIASRIQDRSIAEQILHLFFSGQCKCAAEAGGLPVDTPEDLIVSCAYLEGQRESLSSETAQAMDEKLDIWANLHGMTRPHIEMLPCMSKRASMSFELFPGVTVSSKEALIRAGADFAANRRHMGLEERFQFAENFVEAASEYGVKVPDAVAVYVPGLVEVCPDVESRMALRKSAALMTGASGAEYGALELALRERGEELNIPLAVKLASQVRELDRRYGLGEMYIPSRRRRAAGTLEDAWEAVFQVKKAEQPEQVHIMGREEPLDKAAIVSRYGAGALEIVERKDGSIDLSALKKLQRMVVPGDADG